MDAYLLKNEGDALALTTSTMLRPKTSDMKNQRTLSNLKRVVIMEDIQKYKNILINPDIYPHATIVECLSALLNKLPSADVLRETKIGRIVKRLNSHNNQEVAVLSKNIVDVWSQDIRKRSNMRLLDVKCDLKTKNNRESAKKFLLEALFKRAERFGLSLDSHQKTAAQQIVASFEAGIYQRNGRKTTFSSYNKLLRTLTFKIKSSAVDEVRNFFRENFLKETIWRSIVDFLSEIDETKSIETVLLE